MIKWHALFDDGDQREVLIEEADELSLRAGVLKRFVDARAANKINGRKVRGMWMWMINYATEQADVIIIHGRVPENIDTRFREREGRIARTGTRK